MGGPLRAAPSAARPHLRWRPLPGPPWAGVRADAGVGAGAGPVLGGPGASPQPARSCPPRRGRGHRGRGHRDGRSRGAGGSGGTREGAEGTGKSRGTHGDWGGAGAEPGDPSRGDSPGRSRWPGGGRSLCRAQRDPPGLSPLSSPNSPASPVAPGPPVPSHCPPLLSPCPVPAMSPRSPPVSPPRSPPVSLAPPPLLGRSVALLGGVSSPQSRSREISPSSRGICRPLPGDAGAAGRRHGESGTGPGPGSGGEQGLGGELGRLLKGVLQPGCADRGGPWSPSPRCL